MAFINNFNISIPKESMNGSDKERLIAEKEEGFDPEKKSELQQTITKSSLSQILNNTNKTFTASANRVFRSFTDKFHEAETTVVEATSSIFKEEKEAAPLVITEVKKEPHTKQEDALISELNSKFGIGTKPEQPTLRDMFISELLKTCKNIKDKNFQLDDQNHIILSRELQALAEKVAIEISHFHFNQSILIKYEITNSIKNIDNRNDLLEIFQVFKCLKEANF